MNVLLILLMLAPSPVRDETVRINKSYPIADAENMTVFIDNLNGDVVVESTAGNEVKLTLEIEISAKTEELMKTAKSQLKLGEWIDNDTLSFYTDAPFIKRTKCGDGWRYETNKYPPYAFKYQYKVLVPRAVSLDLKTINGGQVLVKNVEGLIKASNVNGGLELLNVHELSSANAVNGDITIEFKKAPVQPIKFGTVNGDFNLTLPDDFAAQVFFESLNGDLYSSFDYEAIAPKLVKTEKNGTYKIESKAGIEIGSNGPELIFRTVNGSAYLKNEH